MMYDDISRKQKQLGSNEQLCISKTSREKTKIQIIRKNPLSNFYTPRGPQDDFWGWRSVKNTLLDGCYHSVKVLKVFSNSNIYIGPRQFLTQRTRHASVAQLCTRGLFTSTDSSACSWKAFATGESYSIICTFNWNIRSLCFRGRNGCLSDVILADKQSKVWPKWRN